MSFSDGYLRLIEVVRETFPGDERFELTNPYIIDDNAETILATGWGVAALPSTNLNRTASCIYTLARDVEVVLTNVVYGTDRDMARRQEIEAKLMDDQIRLIKAIDQDAVLHDLLAKNNFIGDNGVEFVFTEKNNYLAIVSSWNIERHENT